MGVSTDGILCFGIQLGDEDDVPGWLDGHEDGPLEKIDDIILKLGGHRVERRENESYSDWSKKANAARECVGVELVHHCSGDYSMYILAAKGTVTSAARGYPEEPTMTVSPEQVAKLRKFASAYGVNDEPKWLLCSLWS